MYRVAFLTRAERTLDPDRFASLVQAQHRMRSYKRCGFTAWIETDRGLFVPVPGAKRKPRHL